MARAFMSSRVADKKPAKLGLEAVLMGVAARRCLECD